MHWSENIVAANRSDLAEQPCSSSVLFGQPNPRIPGSSSRLQKILYEINICVPVYILHP
jgi:hypothetical protein